MRSHLELVGAGRNTPPAPICPLHCPLLPPPRSPPAPSKPAGLLSPCSAGKENSGGAAFLPLPEHQPLGPLATPFAVPRASQALPGLQPLAPFSTLSRQSSGMSMAAMPMEEDEAAAIPAYATTPAAYSLFAGGGLGAGAALFGQPEPFGPGGSAFRSALETPSAATAAGELVVSDIWAGRGGACGCSAMRPALHATGSQAPDCA